MEPQLCLSILLLLALPAGSPEAPKRVVAPPPELGASTFHTKFVSAGGFPIVASSRVDDHALLEAAYLVEILLGHRPDARRAMIESGSRLCILAHNEFTTDLPEFAAFQPKDYWDLRARGTGGSETDPYCSVGEENLLNYPGDPYETECILIHEFAHSIHLRGMVRVDPTFDERLRRAHGAAKEEGRWKGTYALVNHHEYFAEGTQSWFGTNRENDHDHNHVNTRAELLAYDPALAALCREVYGDREVVYTKPATRLVDHLADYDPRSAPRFSWPERLARLRTPTHELRALGGWTLLVHRELARSESARLARALELLEQQLGEVSRIVPQDRLAELRKVPLWISPQYPGFGAGAEYHPNAGWLRSNGRHPGMEKCIELTNVPIFEEECRRMPVLILHELAHSYHDRVLGFEEPRIRAAYERARASGSYDRVERKDAAGRSSFDRAYAMTDAKEYFAESTEAFFGRNDFFPFTRDELRAHDPEMCRLLGILWGVEQR